MCFTLYRVTLIFLDASLWRFFDSLLHNEEVRKNATIQPKLIGVVDSIFQHLHYRQSNGLLSASDDELAEIVSQVFNFVFQCYSQFLRPRFDQFTQTLASISSLSLKFMAREATEGQTGPFSPLVDSFLTVLTTALKVYRQLCFDASMQSKVFTAIVEDMLAHFLGIVHLASRLLHTRNSLPEYQSTRMRQVISLIEKTIQHALFSQTHLSEMQGAFSSTIDYAQDAFLIASTTKKKANASNESGAPVAKRSKTGAADDLAPKFANGTEVSKSYSKKLFDWLYTHAISKGDEEAEVVLDAIPFLFRLCLTSIFSGRGRFATNDNDTFGSPMMGSLDTSMTAGEGSENLSGAGDSSANLSQRTMKVLWSLFAALQRICILRIRADTTTFKESSKTADLSKNRHLLLAIASNTSLLSLLREYDIYAHSQLGMTERSSYLARHVTELVSLAKSFSTLDDIFSTLKVILEIDQTFLEDSLGLLLAVVWKQPSAAQLHADSFSAAMIDVYGLLRQIDVLLTRILDQIPSSTIVGFFGPQFWNAFRQNIEILPSGLIVPIFHIFLDNIRKHYIKSASTHISENVVHAEALFNHFLENLKLSPALATQLCAGLDSHVKEICGPLMNDFLQDVKSWTKYNEREDDKKTSKILKGYASSGVPKHAQAGISLYHIFVTFENYCRNRFFPSHNAPEDANLADEASPHFSKLDSSVRLDQICTFIAAIEKIGGDSSAPDASGTPKKSKRNYSKMEIDSVPTAANASGALAWRFKSVLFNSALQRAVKLYKIVSAVPPANLPSLVRRHEQVDTLKSTAYSELTSLLQFISGEFESLDRFLSEMGSSENSATPKISKNPSIHASHASGSSKAQMHTSWHVNDETSYWTFVWDSLCAHAPIVASKQAPDSFASSFVRRLILLKLESSISSSSQKSSSHTDRSTISGNKNDGKIENEFLASSMACWLSASFYEIPGIRSIMIHSFIEELCKILLAQDPLNQISNLISGSSSSKILSKVQSALNSIPESKITKKGGIACDISSERVVTTLVLLNSLPSSMWTLEDLLFALPTLIALLMVSNHINADRSIVIALLHSSTSLISKASSCPSSAKFTDSKVEEDEDKIPSVAILKVLSQESTFEYVLTEKTYENAPFESSQFLASLVELATLDHASQSKAFKFIEKTVEMLQKSIASSEGGDSLKGPDSSKESKITASVRSLHLLQASLQGVNTALQIMDDKCSSQFEWIRQNQRNNVGWRAPPQKTTVYSAKMRKLLESLFNYFQPLSTKIESQKWLASNMSTDANAKTLNKASENEILRWLLVFRSLYSLLDISRLQRTRFSVFAAKNDVILPQSSKTEHSLKVPESLLLEPFVALLHQCFFSCPPASTSKSTNGSFSMQIDGEDTDNVSSSSEKSRRLMMQISFSSFASLSRCLPISGDLVSDSGFSGLSSTLYALLLDEQYGSNAKQLLAIFVPNLSPFQCRFLLSFVLYELHKLTSREKLLLTPPTWKLNEIANTGAAKSQEDERVRSLFVILDVLSHTLKLIDPAVAYDVLSQYSSRLLVILCSLIETATLGSSLSQPLSNSRHVLVISLLTQLIGDKFVDLSGAELNTAASLLSVVLAKHHAVHSAPLLLQITKDLNLSVPLSTWSSIVLFSPEVVTAYYHLLSTALHARPLQTNKNLATIILNAKILLYAVALRTNPAHSSKLKSELDTAPLKKIHAEYVGRLYKDLANLGKFMRSFAVHIIVDYVVLLQREAVTQTIRMALNTGMFALVALLEENEQNLILKAVDATGKSIFRQLVVDYEREYKYAGKA